MKYDVYGPFELDRDKNHYLKKTKSDVLNFWSAVEDEIKGLSNACGCYVFTINDLSLIHI